MRETPHAHGQADPARAAESRCRSLPHRWRLESPRVPGLAVLPGNQGWPAQPSLLKQGGRSRTRAESVSSPQSDATTLLSAPGPDSTPILQPDTAATGKRGRTSHDRRADEEFSPSARRCRHFDGHPLAKWVRSPVHPWKNTNAIGLRAVRAASSRNKARD